ncbi:tripartite motif-containing protein 5-like isoform X3 [Octodon degus]|uniref:Tripartite motif-containing protein 5-like isoform X3 n=1 Tax=Octodon degus TaxID=10160 RepID=A0A6P6DDA1_OCTDE|nr:tripartite motif-containing protein 5-like isoform X3 [Octodon degus]
MASSVLENVKEEVTCPICLELMKDPVSTDCGHYFCKLCITSNYESMQHGEGVGRCPVCRITYQFENLRPSRHVANIVERLRELTLPLKADLCELHGEKLLLFCKEDEEVICWLCEHSQKHCGHHTLLMEEAAQEYRGVKNTMEWCMLFTVQEPRTYPKRQKMVFQAPDLKGILQLHQAPVKLSPSNNENVTIL